MPHIAVLINPRSGGSAQEKIISELLQQPQYSTISLIHLDIKNCKKCITDVVDRGYTTLVAAGGDGTVAAVAQVILENSLPVKCAVLPLGTFNHFAKDIGMPLDIGQGLDVILKGKSAYIDVGKVNDIYFINSSSLGLYPKLVNLREQFQRKGWRKRHAVYAAILLLLRSYQHLTLEFNSQNEPKRKETSLIFISNNKYELGGFNFGTRKYLDQGVLSVGITGKLSVFRFIHFCIHALRSTLVQQKDFNVIGLTECVINTSYRKIHVSHDGEISKLKTPLHYSIVPKALLIIIP